MCFGRHGMNNENHSGRIHFFKQMIERVQNCNLTGSVCISDKYLNILSFNPPAFISMTRLLSALGWKLVTVAKRWKDD